MMAPESVIQNLHQKVWKLNYILSLPPISSPKFSSNSFLFHKPETTGLFFVYFFTVYIDIWSSADLMEFMLSDISKDNKYDRILYIVKGPIAKNKVIYEEKK